jgi:hypothetical protein
MLLASGLQFGPKAAALLHGRKKSDKIVSYNWKDILMKWQTSALQYIAQNDFYFVQPFIVADQFLTFCMNREMQISLSQLEQFDRTGFFRPLARYQRQKAIIKIEQTVDGFRERGTLQEGERWTGETRERTSIFSARDVRGLYDLGQILDSECMPADAWNNSQFLNLYSIFQCYPLWKCLTEMRIASPTVDELATKSDQELADAVMPNYRFLRDQLSDFKTTLQTLNNAALVCQAISNRYYPQTQTDQRTVSIHSVVFDWDWHEYCRTWNAKQTADDMGIALDEIFHLWRRIANETSSVDPLREWDDIMPFISVREKQRLRGKALLADSLKSMATMLTLFYEEISGKPIQTPSLTRRSILLPKEVSDGTLRELEYVANKYHLNPRPRLILMVEGESEADQIPRLMDIFWGFSPSKSGIEILNLKGIANFAGNPKRDFSPLQRFIDEYHHRQTIIYVLLDNEGGAADVKNKLLKSKSAYFEKRAVASDQHIHLWNLNYEFDNFTDREIAQAMSTIAITFQFVEQEVERARQRFKDGRVLENLFQSKTASPLSKRALGRELTALLVAGADSSGMLPKRPILDQLHTIIELAARNHQPTSGEAWEQNQKSGYFGKNVP